MKVVRINAVYGFSSTGRTVKEIHKSLQKHNIDSWVFCTNSNSLDEHVNNIGSRLDYKVHAFLSRLFGLQGYFSIRSTKKLLSKLDNIKPDIVHLHNLHANYINLPLLLKYLAKKNIATVITLHDCWFFTGHCCHYTLDHCSKWQTGCYECPILHKYNNSWFFDNTKRIFNDKKRLFRNIPKLAVIGNSEWTTEQARASFLKDSAIVARVYNWINLDVFYPRDKMIQRRNLNITEDKFIVLGVAQGWSNDKGLDIFKRVAELSPNIVIILVGSILDEYKRELPTNMISVGATSNIDELAEYYSAADLFINPSLQETFGKVSAESLACGTPIIVNNATANPELASEGCGYIVDNNNVSHYLESINRIKQNGKNSYADACVSKAKKDFSMNQNITDTINLYVNLLNS